VINQDGDILQHWLDLPDGIKNFTSTCATQIDDHRFLFSCNFRLYILDLKQQKIKILQPDPLYQNLNFIQLEKLENAKIIASCSKDYLLEIQLTQNAYSCKPYAQLKDTLASTGNFKTDQAGNLYVDIDESFVLVLEPSPDGGHRFSYELPVRGGVTSLMDARDKSGLYLTNTYGLFYIHTDTKKIDPITDQDNLLSQTIYAAIQDTNGEFWLSTNKGILKYSPANGRVKSYSKMDGVQADEFNTDAYLQTKEGGIFFGGINGLNFFHPEQVTLSTKEAPVYISQIKINDEADTTLRVPQFINQYIFPYKRNTISFDFHAIDYSDPAATRVKYKMIGVDQDYIESASARGFARYANLQPGHYTFSILGANADGVWNTVPRDVEITILTPFWMTWWFITLCILTGIVIIYLVIRAYYQRKLELNKQMLREQALIIEKQKAIEHERNRIASEMHDDLGSGLTTIRYLSDKALKQAKDAEESNQIKRISEHSNRLVRNMSEIIWAMNSRFDTAENLVGYLRRYASEYLEEHHIPMKFIASAEHLDKIAMGGERRRNVFLVFKEMLHNTVKYSGAERIEIEIKGNTQLEIHIAEIGGAGFDPALSLENGNGLYNSRKRMDTVGGQLIFEKTSEAMHIHITIPLNDSSGG
jgi:signal transduction histidine kinase